MICKNIKNNLLYNYRFDNKKVIVDDGTETVSLDYNDWIKDFCIIDKWKSLTEIEKKYNTDIKNGKFNCS